MWFDKGAVEDRKVINDKAYTEADYETDCMNIVETVSYPYRKPWWVVIFTKLIAVMTTATNIWKRIQLSSKDEVHYVQRLKATADRWHTYKGWDMLEEQCLWLDEVKLLAYVQFTANNSEQIQIWELMGQRVIRMLTKTEDQVKIKEWGV